MALLVSFVATEPALSRQARPALDPRIELVKLQSADRLEEALDAVDGVLDSFTEESPSGDVDVNSYRYLRAHLLGALQRNQEAADTFSAVASSNSPLARHAHMRVVQLQEELGFTAAASALAADLLATNPSTNLADRALATLGRSLPGAADCRLLERLNNVRLRTSQRRHLDLIRARCALKASEAHGRERLARIIAEDHEDLVALLAADELYPILDRNSGSEIRANLAQVFHHHRRFDRSVLLLQRQIAPDRPPIRSSAEFDLHFQLARGLFWQGQFMEAANSYGVLAERSNTDARRARALFHRSRSLELADQWTDAISSYSQTNNVQPDGSNAGNGLLGSLRLMSRAGRTDSATTFYEVLSSSPRFSQQRRMAALFLASSNISQSKTKGVDQWLDDAERVRRDLETMYWRGRLAELVGEPEEAINLYLRALEDDFFHPLAQDALRRLDQNELRAIALNMGAKYFNQGDRNFEAWVLLGSQNEVGVSARERLEKDLLRRKRRVQLVPTTAVPVEGWPIWRGTRASSTTTAGIEELLLSLGIWTESGETPRRLFPTSEPNLAFTAVGALHRAGRTHAALRIAEPLANSLLKDVPSPVVDPIFRRTLYPLAYQFPLEQAAQRFDVDPLLLAAIIREESRFLPNAASNAAARGLTQFILPTAERFAQQIPGLDGFTPDLLDQPEVAITLGAAYLRDLSAQFGGKPERMLAAYNAGEAQAEVWAKHCHSDDAAEFITKVSFRQTREYVVKVMRSYAQYRDLYPLSAR